MTAPVSKESAAHYTWGDGCDGWHLVHTAELSVIEERMPPGTAEEKHVHERARQFFYVLSGGLTMQMAGAEYVISEGCGLEIAPGVPHRAMNSSGTDVRFLVTSQPPSHGDRTNL